MARSKKACLVFFDEIDAIGGARFDDGAGENCEAHPADSLLIDNCCPMTSCSIDRAKILTLLTTISGGDNEVQRTMLEIVNQLDGFDSRGNIKVHTACYSELLFDKQRNSFNSPHSCCAFIACI